MCPSVGKLARARPLARRRGGHDRQSHPGLQGTGGAETIARLDADGRREQER